MPVSLNDIAKASPEELGAARARVALTNPAQLKAWLDKSGRRFLVLDAKDLVEALSWPHGVEALQELILAYRTQREARGSGEALEIQELDRAIRQLVGEMRELDPTWTLTSIRL